jgi:multidrug resistance efflux pump
VAEAAEPLAPVRRRWPVRPIVVVAVLALIALVAWLLLRGEDRAGKEQFTGYVVADDVYMTSPIAGTLASVAPRGLRCSRSTRPSALPAPSRRRPRSASTRRK